MLTACQPAWYVSRQPRQLIPRNSTRHRLVDTNFRDRVDRDKPTSLALKKNLVHGLDWLQCRTLANPLVSVPPNGPSEPCVLSQGAINSSDDSDFCISCTGLDKPASFRSLCCALWEIHGTTAKGSPFGANIFRLARLLTF